MEEREASGGTEGHTRLPGHANIASAIYGTILVTAVVAGTAASEEVSVAGGILIVLATTLVFWLAHFYANLLALRLTIKRRPAWPEVRRLSGEEWPLVQAGALPILILLLAETGLYGRDTAFAVAMWSGVAALFFWGVVYARYEGSGVAGALASGTFNAALGLIVVALKVIVTH
jgi:hypothetical protein